MIMTDPSNSFRNLLIRLSEITTKEVCFAIVWRLLELRHCLMERIFVIFSKPQALSLVG